LAFVELGFNFLHNADALAVTFACNALNVFWVDAYPLEFVSHGIPFFFGAIYYTLVAEWSLSMVQFKAFFHWFYVTFCPS